MIRKAKLSDVKAIYALVEEFAKKGDMLPRPMLEIYKEVRSFFVLSRTLRWWAPPLWQYVLTVSVRSGA